MARNAIWEGVPSIKGSSESMRMALLTFSLTGLQFTWGLEMTYCTPYLIDLGLSKSMTSLVWVAGPLSGLIMAPLVGAFADRSKSRWGRRRPFMVVGSIIASVCLIALAWAPDITAFFLGQEGARGSPTIAVAVFTIYLLDFAINAVQWSGRSLIIDTLPITKQQAGSAWANRQIGIGHLVGYGLGAIDLHVFLGDLFGNTQFKKMTVLAAFALPLSVAVTCWAVDEAVLVSEANGNQEKALRDILTDIARNTWHMPERIRAICFVQFWSWIGWFPFLFYGPQWVGEIYLKYDTRPRTRTDRLSDIGKIGSRALVIFSLVNFAASVFLPWALETPEDGAKPFTHRPPPFLAPVLEVVHRRKPTLLTAWFASHFVFAGAMFMAPFVTSVNFAAALIAICGIPRCFAGWAPLSFMGIEINRLGKGGASKGSANRRDSNSTLEKRPMKEDSEPDEEDGGGLSGTYLGILNLFTTLPQFIGTAISAVVFAIFEPAHTEGAIDSTEGYNGIAICLFIGAISALAAAQATLHLRGLMER